jgi:hypothetical protein
VTASRDAGASRLFQLSVGVQSWTLQADSDDDAAAWCAAIDDARRARLRKSLPADV